MRTAYGLLFTLQLLMILPFGKVYFTSEKYNGCIEEGSIRNALFKQAYYVPLMCYWILNSLFISAGLFPFLFLSIHLILCHVFFVRLRWKSLTRGMGAPGLVPTWIATLLWMLEYAHLFGDKEGRLGAAILLIFQVDFAFSMIDSGISKITHGYPKNHGLNWGLANPAWSYWWKYFKKLPFRHPVFLIANHAAYLGQILGGILMLIPSTRQIGALVIAGGFLGVMSSIRLGTLCPMLILISAIYLAPNGFTMNWIQTWIPQHFLSDPGMFEAPGWLNKAFGLAATAYLIILPFVKAGIYYNFYARKSLPAVLQKILEFFMNVFGIIMWRVFTVETVDFFINTYLCDKKTGKRSLVTRYGAFSWSKNNRFIWVGESLMENVLFNTERYFPNTDLMTRRLIRFAKTFFPNDSQMLIFEYVVIVPDEKGYHFISAKEYHVNTHTLSVQEVILDCSVEVPLKHPSPVRPSAKPGTYKPL